MEFPCRNCLVKTCCSVFCDKLLSDKRTITMYLMTYKTCPDCGSQQVQINPDSQIMLCQECSKVFVKKRCFEIDVGLIGSSSSTSSASGVSMISSSGPLVIQSTNISPRVFSITNNSIITGINKYHPVTMEPESVGGKAEKMPAPTEKIRRREHIEFDRMTPMYSKTLIEKVDQLVTSRLTVSNRVFYGMEPKPPKWIFKHKDLFVKDPREEEYDEDCGYEIELGI